LEDWSLAWSLWPPSGQQFLIQAALSTLVTGATAISVWSINLVARARRQLLPGTKPGLTDLRALLDLREHRDRGRSWTSGPTGHRSGRCCGLRNHKHARNSSPQRQHRSDRELSFWEARNRRGYVAPSVLDTASSSRPEGDNGWRVEFKSNGGMGEAAVYAICVSVS
jgi:hypothetical protein